MANQTDTGDGGREREAGIEFGDLKDDLEAESYPMTLEELLAEHGDEELGVGDETVTLREVLEPLEEDTYESRDEVTQAVFNMVDRDAVGRQRYSDRGGTAPDEGGGEDEEDDSF